MKTVLQETQEKQGMAFAACMMCFHFVIVAGGIAVLSARGGDLRTAAWLAAAAVLLCWPMRVSGRRFLRLGDEVERLRMQEH